jgi:hypothetical protein
MAVKPKVKLKAKIKARPKSTGKSKVAVKVKVAKKIILKPAKKEKPIRKLMTKPNTVKERPSSALIVKPEAIVEAPVAVKTKLVAPAKAVVPLVKRPLNPLVERRRPAKRSTRGNQFNFMKAPELESAFEVGDTVEVFCDHDKNKERSRGWIKGIVVQVDHKMVAVQFRSNVYLTDGWMVPDRILWYPVNSEHIRAVAGKKVVKDKRDFIPDY